MIRFCFVVVFCLSSVFSFGNLVVGTSDIGYIGSDINETVSTQVLNEGSLRKVGTGDTAVPLHKLSSMDGRIDVLDGSLTVTADGSAYELAEKPWDILDKATFWVDANTNVLTYVSNDVTYVSQWLDVREPNQTGPWQYLRAVSQTTFTNYYSELLTDDAGVYTNLSSVYFGGYSSRRWMEFQNSSSNRTTLGSVRNVFLVFGAHDGYGFILGCNPGSTYADFHPAAYSGNGGTIWSASQFMHRIKTGATYLNREKIDGTKVVPQPDFQMLETVTGSKDGAHISNFCNDRDIDWAGVRIGGERICEVIIFETRLSEAERLQVEQYLWQKWLSTEQDYEPRISVAEGKFVDISVSSGVAGNVIFEGDGTFVKSGAGTLTVGVDVNTEVFNGITSFEAGEIVPYLPIPVNVADGQRITADADAFSISSVADGQLVKGGEVELVLHEVPDGVERITVEEGILQIAQPLATEEWPTNTAGYIPSPSFEFGAYKDYYNGETYGGWTATENTNDIHSRVFVHSQDETWHAPFPAPDGDYALALKADVGMETTMTVPVNGVYVLSFLASGRISLDGHEFDIIIDDTNRVATVQTWATEYVRFRYRLPWLEAGEHTLLLKAISSDDRMSNLDDFHLDLLSMAPPLNVMTNAGFECAQYSAQATQINAPTNSGWEYTTSGSNMVMIAAVGSAYGLVPEYERRLLVIKNQGSAFTTMVFPESGTYELSFNVARWRSNVYESIANQTVSVMVGGVNVSTLTTYSQIFERQTTDAFSASAGVPLTLTLTGTTADNRVLLIDDIAAMEADDDNLIENGGFESGSDGWDMIYDQTYITKMKADVLAYISNQDYFGPNVFEGNSRLRLTQTGLAKQSVTLNETGSYRLTFHAVSRVDHGNVDVHGRNPVIAFVSRNGITNNIGYINSYDEFFRRHEFNFAITEAGTYDIGLQGQRSEPAGDYNTMIDSVSLEKVDMAEIGEPIPEDTTIELAAGTKLNLNYIGTLSVDTLRYNGTILTGTISNETCPEFIYGSGVIYSSPKGTIIILQ
ncbi:MAG: hypothetical protein PF904_01270 [Kiritimatiellae bacterium]|jgi:hypothetical protein|nr:hypothetical protein [Kiritimatiellia bacterium]